MGAFLAMNSMTIALGVNLSQVDDHQRIVLQAVPMIVALLVGILLGGPMLATAWRELSAGRITIEILFLLSIGGAFSASLISFITGKGPVYFEVVSVLIVVYGLGHQIGKYAKSKVVLALAEWDPETTSCELIDGNGAAHVVRIAEIRTHDYVRVHPGSMIPVDGIVRSGSAFVHEAGLTGESFAASRMPGDAIHAGARVMDATIVVEAMTDGSRRSLDRMREALFDAMNQPGASQIMANRIMPWFVPLVVSVAAGTFVYHDVRSDWGPALFDAMSVLLVACPCALGFATPVAVWTTIQHLNRLGLVVKSGTAIERLANVTCIAFDKTGTLTLLESAPVLDVRPAWTNRSQFLRDLIGAAEAPISHPIASVLAQLRSNTSKFFAKSVRLEAGRGIAAEVETDLRIRHVVRLTRMEAESPRLLVEIDGEAAATISVDEAQRPGLTETFRELAQRGINVVLMTGDKAVRAARLPIADRHTELTPQQKHDLIRELKKRHHVLFIGDGLNDTIAMAESDVAIAVGAEAGLPQEVAAAEWKTPDFSLLPQVIAIAEQMTRIIRSNLLFALVYNTAGMAIAACGILHPVVAALLMTTSSCLVTLRSLQFLSSREHTSGKLAVEPHSCT
jgi:heavy metal translocating P-type ATPase